MKKRPVPWQNTDIHHDDPEAFPLEDYFPLFALNGKNEEQSLSEELETDWYL